MQFFVTLTLDQATTSPAQLQSAMTEFVENELQAGTFVITGGSPHIRTPCGSSSLRAASSRATHVCRSTASQLSRRPRSTKQLRLHPA
jgi:hypothetical protein